MNNPLVLLLAPEPDHAPCINSPKSFAPPPLDVVIKSIDVKGQNRVLTYPTVGNIENEKFQNSTILFWL